MASRSTKSADDGGLSGAASHTNGQSRKRPGDLTKNEKLVWDVLAGGVEPLKAYEILDKLKEKGVRAPMTIYRALDGLESKGFIHKLDGLNAFVLCTHEGPHPVQTFLVCESCATVEEIELGVAEADVAPAALRAGFDMHIARLEIKGLCANCASAGAGH